MIKPILTEKAREDFNKLSSELWDYVVDEEVDLAEMMVDWLDRFASGEDILAAERDGGFYFDFGPCPLYYKDTDEMYRGIWLNTWELANADEFIGYKKTMFLLEMAS